MKRIVLLLCACVGAVSAMAEQADSTKVKKESHSLNLYGFARAEMYVNSRENYEAKGGIISLYPKPIELDDYGFDKNAKVNAGFLAITSRVGLKYTYNIDDLSLGAHIEGDFCGTSTYIDIFRLRHAYAFVNYKNHSVLAGQSWHPYYDGVFPNVLTLNGGTPTGIINRSPQIRYDYSVMPELRLTAAFVSEGVKGIRPEAIIGLARSKDGWKYGVMGEYRYLNIEHTFVSDKGTTVRPQPLHSFSGTAYTEYRKDKWMFNARVMGGQNISHLVILGGYGLVSEDTETLTAKYSNLNQLATYACASYGSKWKVNLFAGYLKNFGTSESCSALYGTGVNVADVIKTAASVEYNYKGLNVALECEYSNAAYANYIETKLLEDYRVGNIRGVLRVSYNFSHTWKFANK